MCTYVGHAIRGESDLLGVRDSGLSVQTNIVRSQAVSDFHSLSKHVCSKDVSGKGMESYLHPVFTSGSLWNQN